MSQAMLAILIGAFPVFVLAAMMMLRKQADRERLEWRGPARGPRFRLPEAAETAESIRRFHEAVERWRLIDFAWERYARGRALLQVAVPSPRRRRRA